MNKKKNLITLLIIALLLITGQVKTAQATQTIEVNEYTTALAKVSRRQLNRIIAPSDITGIFTSNKRVDIKIDGRNAYLNLSNVQTNEGIEFYITAEATYALVLVPDQIASETIVLKAGLKDRGAAVTWEKAHDYVKTIKDLVKGMETGTVPPGYRNIEFNMKEPMWQEADVTLVSEYSGGAMHGRIYNVKNISKADIRFGENEFYKKGIRAIAVKLSTLKPGESTVVYLVGDGRAWGNLVKTPPPVFPTGQQNNMLPSAPDVRGE